MARICAIIHRWHVYLAHDEPFYVVPPEKWNTLALVAPLPRFSSPRFFLWQRRVLGPAVVGAIHEVDASRPVIEAAGHPFTTNHLYLAGTTVSSGTSNAPFGYSLASGAFANGVRGAGYA